MNVKFSNSYFISAQLVCKSNCQQQQSQLQAIIAETEGQTMRKLWNVAGQRLPTGHSLRIYPHPPRQLG
jgi:hypothetical protein